MSEACSCLGCNVGASVPDFTLETYETAKGDFGEISLETLKNNRKWTEEGDKTLKPSAKLVGRVHQEM